MSSYHWMNELTRQPWYQSFHFWFCDRKTDQHQDYNLQFLEVVMLLQSLFDKKLHEMILVWFQVIPEQGRDVEGNELFQDGSGQKVHERRFWCCCWWIDCCKVPFYLKSICSIDWPLERCLLDWITFPPTPHVLKWMNTLELFWIEN